MNESENKFGTAVEPGVEDLREELRSFQLLVLAALCVLIVLSASVDGYLLKQVSMVRGEATQTQKLVENFNVRGAQDFWARLTDFARSHPDFAPILGKYLPYANQTVFAYPMQPAPKK